MGTHRYGKNGELVRFSRYDTSLMCSLKNVFEDDNKLAFELLDFNKDYKGGSLQKNFNVRDSSGLVRKIFRVYLKGVLWCVISGKHTYHAAGNSKAIIKVDLHPDPITESFINDPSYNDIFRYPMAGQWTTPVLKYQFSSSSKRSDLRIYLNKKFYARLKQTMKEPKTGAIFSKFPKSFNYFIPIVYEMFPDIKKSSIDKIVRLCSRSMVKLLRQGNELRILDADGEIRVYRNLGSENHDKIMKRVKRRMDTIKRKKQAEIALNLLNSNSVQSAA